MLGNPIKSLLGHTITSVSIEDDGHRMVITTRSHRFVFHSEGDCCAVAYLMKPCDKDIQSIIGQEVVAVNAHGFKTEERGDWGDVIDTQFYSIQTHNGDLDLELRTSHNGYYGGWITLTSMEECWPVFDDIREEAQADM